MASKAPDTPSQRIEALTELRALTASVGPFSRHFIAEAVSKLEDELVADATELIALLERATSDEVKALLEQELKRIEAAAGAASGAENEKEPSARPPVDAGSVADDEADGDEDSEPAAASAAGEPREWPLASQDSLPAECWRSSFEPVREVPRCRFGSKAALRLMEQRKPVILTGGALVGQAAGKWTLDFLRDNLREVPCTVYASQTRHFRYWDKEKNEAGYPFTSGERTQKLVMGVDEFSERLKAASAEAASGAAAAPTGGGGDGAPTRYYFQSALVEGVGEAMMADFRSFDWDNLLLLQRKLGWGTLTSNLLLIGQANNTTPAHYDEQQNLFAQLDGTKRCVLFDPADFRCLYPFPVHHPCDRQSQVDLYHPDVHTFPKFAEARPLEAVLQPGEVLYIPQYWWHHIENLSDACVSLNFWFKDTARPQKVELPLESHRNLAMRRNIEKLVASELGSAAKAQHVLPQLATGEVSGEDGALAPLREKVRSLLGHVMEEEEIDLWLQELVERRFDLATPDPNLV